LSDLENEGASGSKDNNFLNARKRKESYLSKNSSEENSSGEEDN